MKMYKIFGLAMVMTVFGINTGYADYEIGSFTAQRGPAGAACQATETRTRCGDAGTDNCNDTTRKGFKVERHACDGTVLPVEWLYDGVQGPSGCTPNYTEKYINKVNGEITYSDTKTESTIGMRAIVSGCGSTTNIDAYNGDNGTSFHYMGSVQSCAALNDISNPASNDAYIVNGDGNGKLCIYNGSSWPTNCPDDCAEFTGPQGNPGLGVCDNVSDTTTAVKNTVRTYIAQNGNTRGYMKLHHTMCSDSVTVDDKIEDECVPVMPASASTCSSGTYLECTPQNDGDVYYICTPTTNTTLSSAMNALSNSMANKVDQDSFNTVSGKVTALETAVGTSSSGLIQKVNGLETTVGNKLDNDVSFTTSNGYIQMTAGGTTVNVATVASLKGDKGDKGDSGNNGSSIFDIWKAQQTDATTCQGLFNKTCANLTESDMLTDLSAYGNWKRTTYTANPSADLSQTAYQNALKPCQLYTISEAADQSGTDGGTRYEFTCVN